MRRTDIRMTENLKNFLAFELGHMNEDLYTKKIKDIEYTPGLKLDLYYPEEEKETYPLVISIYGGGWVSGFKTDAFVEPMIKPVREGYAVAVPDYTLALDDVFPRPVLDLKQCILFLREHAQEYHLDPENITLYGESAGGHLVLMAGLMPDSELGITGDTSVKNIAAMYPLTDALTAYDQAVQLGIPAQVGLEDCVFSVFMGKDWNNEEANRKASPVTWIRPGMPKIVLEHGTGDQMVPYLQSLEFFRRAMETDPAADVTLRLIGAKAHTDPWFFTDEHIHELFSVLLKG
ncbi:MAG: alpha/beta hydrolase [Solobacterium sp.]|nr:alpha/beta hydrolase [Solobacterium sp.]